MKMLPTFSYWDADDLAPIQEHIAHWRETFPTHRVVTRQEARAALIDLEPEAGDLFDRICIPACRSDLARLAVLVHDGGLYVDTHCRIGDVEGIRRHLASLEHFELVVSTRWAPNYKKIMPFNGIIFARPGSQILRELLQTGVEQLKQQDSAEATFGFQPYHVWSLSGPGLFWNTLFETERDDGALSTRAIDNLNTVFETENPIERYAFMSYRAPGSHWFERQQTEPLFSRRE